VALKLLEHLVSVRDLNISKTRDSSSAGKFNRKSKCVNLHFGARWTKDAAQPDRKFRVSGRRMAC
jgi:hypothetical protein